MGSVYEGMLRSSNGLREIVLSFPAGATEWVSTLAFYPTIVEEKQAEKAYLATKQQLKWLELKLASMKEMMQRRRNSQVSTLEERDLREGRMLDEVKMQYIMENDELQKAYLVTKEMQTRLALFLRRLAQSDLHMKYLLGDVEEEQGKLAEILQLSSAQKIEKGLEVNQLLNRIQQMEARLTDLQGQNKTLRDRNKELWFQIEGVKDAKGEFNLADDPNILHARRKNILLKNVLTRLILAAGVNWALDPTLRNIMLNFNQEC